MSSQRYGMVLQMPKANRKPPSSVDQVRAHRHYAKIVELGGFKGTAEVAEALGVRVQNLQFIKDLPEPAFKIRATRVWLSADILEFAVKYKSRQAARLAKAS